MPFCHVTLRGQKPPRPDYPPEVETLGDRIRARRIDLGLRQRDVAEMIGVSSFTVGNWEAGKTDPAVQYLPRIANFLGPLQLKPAELPSDFPARLQVIRRDLGLTQSQLAERLGVDESTVWGWEKGRHRPGRWSSAKLEILPSLDWLVTSTGDRRRG